MVIARNQQILVRHCWKIPRDRSKYVGNYEFLGENEPWKALPRNFLMNKSEQFLT